MRTMGTVKWFDPKTGAGCAVSEGGTQAAFTAALLQPFGLSAIDAGVALTYDVKLESGRLVVGAIYEIGGKEPQPGAATPGASTSLRVKGRVVWYHPAKGYGFIVSKDIAGDVLLHRSVLEAFGLDAIREGAVLDVDVAQKVWGSQVRSQVKHIHAMLAPDKPLGPAQPLVPPPLGGAIVLDPGVFGTLRGSSVRLVGPPILSPGLSKGFGFVVHDDEDEGDGTDTPWFDAVCKWFSRPKGYGFVALSGSDQDVFVHMEVLRQCGIRELRQGQRVRVQAVHTPKGMIAVEVELA